MYFCIEIDDLALKKLYCLKNKIQEKKKTKNIKVLNISENYGLCENIFMHSFKK